MITPQSEDAVAGRVAVVIPAHNAAGSISRALDSVFVQAENVGQVIVVDDGSTDATAEIVGAYPGVELIQQAQAGAAAARNSGMKNATCSYVAFLDADDWWEPGKLAEQLRVLDCNGDVGLVFSDFVNIDDQGGRCNGFVQHKGIFDLKNREADAVMLFSDNIFSAMCADLFVATSTVLMRRECISEVGEFAPYVVAEDLDYWLRSALLTRFAAINRVLVNKRNRSDSLGSNAGKTLQETANVLAGFPRRFPGLSAGQRRALRRRLAEVLYEQGFSARKSGERLHALNFQVRSFTRRPTKLSIFEIGKILAWR